MSKSRTIALAALTAAATAYFTAGRGAGNRRAHAAARVRQAARHERRLTRHWFSECRGVLMRATHRPGPAADDLTLLDRVESTLFADPTIPKGRLNLEVVNGILFLRGAVRDWAEAAAVETAAYSVPGVTDLRSLLHLEGTPAPNKLAALRASAAAG